MKGMQTPEATGKRKVLIKMTGELRRGGASARYFLQATA